TTGALWSSRTMTVRPLSSVVSVTPAGSDGISPFLIADIPEWRSRLAWLRFWRWLHCCPALRQKRFAERLFKIITVLEIVAGVLVRLGEQTDFHHVENNFAEVL